MIFALKEDFDILPKVFVMPVLTIQVCDQGDIKEAVNSLQALNRKSRWKDSKLHCADAKDGQTSGKYCRSKEMRDDGAGRKEGGVKEQWCVCVEAFGETFGLACQNPGTIRQRREDASQSTHSLETKKEKKKKQKKTQLLQKHIRAFQPPKS